jgi:hypothetical protein
MIYTRLDSQLEEITKANEVLGVLETVNKKVSQFKPSKIAKEFNAMHKDYYNLFWSCDYEGPEADSFFADVDKFNAKYSPVVSIICSKKGANDLDFKPFFFIDVRESHTHLNTERFAYLRGGALVAFEKFVQDWLNGIEEAIANKQESIANMVEYLDELKTSVKLELEDKIKWINS